MSASCALLDLIVAPDHAKWQLAADNGYGRIATNFHGRSITRVSRYVTAVTECKLPRSVAGASWPSAIRTRVRWGRWPSQCPRSTMRLAISAHRERSNRSGLLLVGARVSLVRRDTVASSSERRSIPHRQPRADRAPTSRARSTREPPTRRAGRGPGSPPASVPPRAPLRRARGADP